MKISVVDPVGPAIGHAKRILFQPFNLGKWFVLGFCAFLAYLGEGGGGFPPGSGGGGGGGGGGGSGGGAAGGGGDASSDGQQVIDWINANLVLIVVVALVVILFMLVIGGILVWLRSRAKFMFLDGVVRNRGAVVEPWNTYRAHGNSLFLFSFTLSVAVSALAIAIVVIGAMLAWPDIQSGRLGGASIAAIAVGGLLLLAIAIGSAIVGTLLEDFVVPAMYRHDLLVMSAWSVVGSRILVGHVGTIILYFLMKILLGLAIGIMALIATCATCCLVAIPYLGTVILLPLLVFIRCYSLCFLEQFGPEWQFFERPVPEITTPPAPGWA